MALQYMGFSDSRLLIKRCRSRCTEQFQRAVQSLASAFLPISPTIAPWSPQKFLSSFHSQTCGSCHLKMESLLEIINYFQNGKKLKKSGWLKTYLVLCCRWKDSRFWRPCPKAGTPLLLPAVRSTACQPFPWLCPQMSGQRLRSLKSHNNNNRINYMNGHISNVNALLAMSWNAKSKRPSHTASSPWSSQHHMVTWGDQLNETLRCPTGSDPMRVTIEARGRGGDRRGVGEGGVELRSL